MAVSCSVIFDLAAMLDVEPALGGYVLVVLLMMRAVATRCSRCSLCVRRNKWRVARAAREQHTQAVLSYAAASAGVTLRRWHLSATDVLLAPMRLAHSRGSLVRARTQAETRLSFA